MNNFSELNVCSALKNNLKRQGLSNPTPVQSQAIPPALEGRDLVATAPTGTGKTIAFVLPLLEALMAESDQKGIGALIVTPTRELAIQIHEVFTSLALGTGVRSAVVVGGLNEQKQLNDIRKGARVVIATPGRLCDFLNRKLVKLGATSRLVLDEADRMLDMGFLPDIRQIVASLPEKRQTLFFSATIEDDAARLIDRYLTDPKRIAIGSTTKPAEDVELHIYEVEQEQKLPLLHSMLGREQGSFLVFTRTKHRADRLARSLAKDGVKAARIHGDRTQNQRNQALRGFQQGRFRVLVATDVAARGIHVENIAHVVNYDLPKAPEDFIHRVGRTGRAGLRGTASTFGSRSERGDVRKIERKLKIRLIQCEPGSDLPVRTNAEFTATAEESAVPAWAKKRMARSESLPRHTAASTYRWQSGKPSSIRGGRREFEEYEAPISDSDSPRMESTPAKKSKPKRRANGDVSGKRPRFTGEEDRGKEAVRIQVKEPQGNCWKAGTKELRVEIKDTRRAYCPHGCCPWALFKAC